MELGGEVLQQHHLGLLDVVDELQQPVLLVTLVLGVAPLALHGEGRLQSLVFLLLLAFLLLPDPALLLLLQPLLLLLQVSLLLLLLLNLLSPLLVLLSLPLLRLSLNRNTGYSLYTCTLTNQRPVFRSRDLVWTNQRPVFRSRDLVWTNQRPVFRSHLKLLVCLGLKLLQLLLPDLAVRDLDTRLLEILKM